MIKTLVQRLFQSQIKSGSGVIKMVIVMRTDLGMGKGKMAAMSAHAAVLCYRSSAKEKRDLWLSYGQPKIVVRVNSLSSLESIHKAAQREGICAEVVYDAGLTCVPSGTMTALGLGPDFASEIDKIAGDLKLL